MAKGENTSAIYRLKISDKYAFVQTYSKLITRQESDELIMLEELQDEKDQQEITTKNDKSSFLKKNNYLSDLNSSDTEIILASHSIIK